LRDNDAFAPKNSKCHHLRVPSDDGRKFNNNFNVSWTVNIDMRQRPVRQGASGNPRPLLAEAVEEL
jgi:hypothetical protein